jgi:hypothetical protein
VQWIRDRSLGLVFASLFLAAWFGQLVVEWFTFADEQQTHGEGAVFFSTEFWAAFWQSTLENWQSEFLQLFAFVSLAGLYIYKGSAESKDSDEKVEASLRRIEEHLGTLPPDPPSAESGWKLPDAPDGSDGSTEDLTRTTT